MTITIKALLTAPLLDSTFAAVNIADVRGNVYDGLTVVGFTDTVTLTGRTISFDPSGTFSREKLYQVELAKTTGGEVLTTRDWVWIRAASGEFLAGDPNEIAAFQTYKQGFPALERSTADTAVIEFQWPISGATFANSATTCKRIFLGETGSQEEAMSGAITAISGRAGWYKIAYNVADRAATGTTVVPTSVTYTLVDDAGNTGYLTLVIVEFADGSTADILQLLTSGNVSSTAPVSTSGLIPSIVIGDDYKASSTRSFDWIIPVPSFSRTGSRCYFGGAATHRGEWLVEGAISEITVDTVPKWKLQFELAKTDTSACKPGCYHWSVELRGPSPEQITKIIGTTDLIEAYTR